MSARTLAEQLIPLESVKNARDLGGYVGADGRLVKCGKLLRSGGLSELSEKDAALLKESYDITLVIDLRSSAEQASAPDTAVEGMRVAKIPLLNEALTPPSLMSEENLEEYSTPNGLLKLARTGFINSDTYCAGLNDEYSQARFREIFNLIVENRDHGTLFHCTAGKDRTGLFGMLMLAALGVDRQDCIADFALTNEAYRDAIDCIMDAVRQETDDEEELFAIEALAGVCPAYARDFFDRAEQGYGSMLGFIQGPVGVTDEQLELLHESFLER